MTGWCLLVCTVAGNACADDVKHFFDGIRKIGVVIRIERDSVPRPVAANELDVATGGQSATQHCHLPSQLRLLELT